MLEYVRAAVEPIEHSIDDSTTRAELLERLRSLGLSDFGELLINMPDPQFPKISKLLPRMADNEVQMKWTGRAHYDLLVQSLDFVRALVYNYAKYTGRSLEDQRILDFGVGYGRLARLMYYFTSEDNFFGVDAWAESVAISHADGLVQNILKSDEYPESLPLDERSFDLIFAFSVFTHLSERATRANLTTLSKYLKPDGLLCITIRPLEYWDLDPRVVKRSMTEEMKAAHRAEGFSFIPHAREAVDGDIAYGDTSMTLEWLDANFPDLRIRGIDRSLTDPYQIYVFLSARDAVS